MKEFFKIRSKKANRARIQVITIAVSLMLVAAIAIGGTVAWLVDTTESVTNTFTFGDIDITLTETGAVKDSNGNFKKEYTDLVPGATVPKDPKVTVTDGSVTRWLFVKIEKSTTFDTYFKADPATGWKAVTGAEGVYVYVGSVADGTPISILLDDKITVNSDVKKADIDALDAPSAVQPTITFTAYAIQKENLTDTNGTTITTAEGAWALINPQP
jgi:hypothetical protein